LTTVDNAGKARSWGGEAQLDWAPSSALRVGLRAGYTDATYREFRPTPALDFSGKELEYVPEYTFGFDASYTFESGVMVAADVLESAGRWLDNANTKKGPGYTLINARLGYAWSHFSVAAVGKNLLDEDWVTRGVTAPGFPFLGQWTDPRSGAIELGFEF
jgi:iron complex outermembrane receptor protein